mgnify:CR=1 FL=1
MPAKRIEVGTEEISTIPSVIEWPLRIGGGVVFNFRSYGKSFGLNGIYRKGFVY